MKPLNKDEVKFYRKLSESVKIMHHWRDESLLQKGLDVLPVEELNIKATIRLSSVGETNDISFEDCMILELLDWFKNSFFSWMDAPKCEACDKIALSNKSVPPTDEELRWNASFVEQFTCPGCARTFRFPRYNHSGKLLETRKGRCGEWANCFTFLLLSLGYQARLALDWSDHAWSEYFSPSRGRWLHCDPCEGACDTPLLYEQGWKKQLSYVIAFSPVEIQDVTWRYTTNFKEVLARRRECREEFLLHCLLYFQQKLEEHLRPEDRKELARARALELAEFLTPPTAGSATYEGRTSGDIAWRIARGEIVPASNSSHVFRLTPEEADQRRFRLRYSCAKDVYMKDTEGSCDPQGVQGWTTLAFSRENVFRKVESDWKMAYLARCEGSDCGALSWKFDFSEHRTVMRSLEMRLSCHTFESGSVRWTLQLESRPPLRLQVDSEDAVRLGKEELKGAFGFILSVELRGGSSWQHAQAFRQSLDSDAWPFQIDVHFERDSL